MTDAVGKGPAHANVLASKKKVVHADFDESESSTHECGEGSASKNTRTDEHFALAPICDFSQRHGRESLLRNHVDSQVRGVFDVMP